ncbi:hypothetical protein O6H91_16G075900 [Diphasiastrum complanatum]|uniref:Uncharacterized protein n=2 Tax=Diphasiastrum complanatum TaxID=34168 RepID=A0ACC2BDV9_DIPCM|nr:hypothetical protein O6H91_16G075900 [Diphasiastrum complanatum]
MSSSGGSVHVFHEPGRGSNRPVLGSYKERKSFMSPRASDIFREVSTDRLQQSDDDVDREEFREILKEVEQLGTSQLSWKARKEWEAKKLLALGAKAPKSHKMPIEMGRNIKRKRELMEEQKRLQDGVAGLATATSSSKKKFASRNVENHGLRASEGIFKGGILHVKPLPKKSANFNSRRNNGLGGIFSVGMKSEKSKKKKTKKHKGKRRK